MGSSFECVGVAWELTLVKVFSQILGEQGHTCWVLGRLDSGQIVHFFWCNKGLYPEIYYYFIFCLYSNYTGGGDLDLIDFQLQIFTH